MPGHLIDRKTLWPFQPTEQWFFIILYYLGVKMKLSGIKKNHVIGLSLHSKRWAPWWRTTCPGGWVSSRRGSTTSPSCPVSTRYRKCIKKKTHIKHFCILKTKFLNFHIFDLISFNDLGYLTIYSSVSHPSHFDMDPDPDPGIHIWKKWIRFQSGSGSEYLFFIFFIKKFMSDPPFRNSGSGSLDSPFRNIGSGSSD